MSKLGTTLEELAQQIPMDLLLKNNGEKGSEWSSAMRLPCKQRQGGLMRNGPESKQ